MDFLHENITFCRHLRFESTFLLVHTNLQLLFFVIATKKQANQSIITGMLDYELTEHITMLLFFSAVVIKLIIIINVSIKFYPNSNNY